MSDEVENDVQEVSDYPAMEKAGRSPGFERVKYLVQKVGLTALKDAVIVGLALAVPAILGFGGPAAIIAGTLGWLPGGIGATITSLAAGATSTMGLSAFMTGASFGGIAGALIGTMQGLDGVDDYLADMEQSMVTRGQRAQQLTTNQQTPAMGMSRLQAAQQGMAQGYAAQPQLPYGVNPAAGRGAVV